MTRQDGEQRENASPCSVVECGLVRGHRRAREEKDGNPDALAGWTPFLDHWTLRDNKNVPTER